MRACVDCSHVNKNNMWCIVKTDFVSDTDSCVSFNFNDTPQTKCLLCKGYNVLSNYCTTIRKTVSAQYCCDDFETKIEVNNKTKFIGIVVGGCTKYEHGTDLYKRCREWLDTIKADDSKEQGVRVIFTKLDYPTPLFWRSFLEKIYHLYDQKWIKDKVCFRGLTDKMLNEAMFVANIILSEKHV